MTTSSPMGGARAAGRGPSHDAVPAGRSHPGPLGDHIRNLEHLLDELTLHGEIELERP